MKNQLISLIVGALFAGCALAEELGIVTPEQLLDMQKNRNALVVDVRTSAEWQASGVIAESYKLQAFDGNGQFDRDKWLSSLQQLKSSPDQPVILVCRSGNRSGKVGEMLTKQLGMNNIYHLPNGIDGWFRSGRPLIPNCLQVACK